MQDNHLHKDQQLTDQGWQQMKRLLDQELPVGKNRKNRLFFWWLSGSISIAATIAVFILWSPAKQESIDQTTSSITETSTPLDHQPTTKPLNNKVKTNQQVPSTTHQAIINTPKIQTAVTAQTQNNIASDKSHTHLPTSINTLPLSDKESVSTTTNQVEEKAPVIQSAPTSTPASVTRTPLDKIAYLTADLLQYDRKIEPLIFKEKISQSTLSNTVYFHTSFLPFTKKSGMGIGYQKAFKLKADHWSLSAGIGYQYIKQPLDYVISTTEYVGANELYQDEFLLDIAYTNSSSNVVEFSSNTAFRSPNASYNRLKLHYLNFPVNLNHHKGKWWFNGGVNTGLLLTASNNIISGGVISNIRSTADSSENLFLPGTQDPLGIAENNSDQLKVANLDFSATVGIGYHLSPIAGIHLQYSHGLRDILINNTEKDFNRIFQLSIQYSW